jgi:hypothetical protein
MTARDALSDRIVCIPSGGSFRGHNAHSVAFVTIYAAFGSMRVVVAYAALGISMFKTPSHKIALTFELSTSDGRSKTRRISFAHRSE